MGPTICAAARTATLASAQQTLAPKREQDADGAASRRA